MGGRQPNPGTPCPWSWVIIGGGFDIPVDLVVMLEGINMEHASYPKHKTRPLPWFEQIPGLEDEGASLEQWIDMHKRFQGKLEKSISPDRLLVYNVKEG